MNKRLQEEFIVELFACILTDVDFFNTVNQHLKEIYLPEERFKEVWGFVKRFYTKKSKLPTIGILKQNFSSKDLVIDFIEEIKNTTFTTVDSKIVIEEFNEFIKKVKFVEIFDKVPEIYRKDQDKAFDLFLKTAEELMNFSISNTKSTSIFGDFQKRHIDRISNTSLLKDRLPFGIDPLDNILNGIEKTEIACFLAGSGKGKSFLLIWLGLSMARRGYKVAHFQIEGTKKQVQDRYDSAWTGSLYFDIKKAEISEDKYLESLNKLKSVGTGDVYVQAYESFEGTTMVDIKNDFRELEKQHGKMDAILIDYLELLHPGDGVNYSPDQKRHMKLKNARLFKGLAMECNVAGITVDQAHNISPESLNDPDFYITSYNTSECKTFSQPFDLFFTINQTKDEKEDQICRIWQDKTREHKGNELIYLAQRLSRSRFYDKKRTLELFADEADEE